CRKCHVRAPELLHHRGSQVNSRNKDRNTPLIFASLTGPTLLTMAPGSTTLSVQPSEGQIEMVELLLDAGSDPNAATNDGLTALMAACGEGHSKIVELLLEAGADATAENKTGSTPFSLACEEHHHKVMELLAPHYR
ncbi:MAG: ankyrin repeat domain-containing protein, partial [Deltaproteobacteria bacterium]